jgi:hypothetical protein
MDRSVFVDETQTFEGQVAMNAFRASQAARWHRERELSREAGGRERRFRWLGPQQPARAARPAA